VLRSIKNGIQTVKKYHSCNFQRFRGDSEELSANWGKSGKWLSKCLFCLCCRRDYCCFYGTGWSDTVPA